jgi:hypothetical protein
MSKILCFATKGSGSNEESRIRILLQQLDADVWPFDPENKLRSGLALFRDLRKCRPALAVMEGTGLAGGLALLAARWLHGVPYVVSSGDAVAPFLAARHRMLWPAAWLYERLLYRMSSGFVGWTPYLAGRALTLGAPRAMSAANWSLYPAADDSRDRVRAELEIPDDAILFGLIGSLRWNTRVGYCYGLELVRAIQSVDRPDVVVLVAGDGDGRRRLEHVAGSRLGSAVKLPGPIPHEQVPSYLAAIDVGSLPQSVDQVGAFRYTTKLSEYLAAGLPIVTGQIPLSYDLDDGWLWRLPGDAPWDARYIEALGRLMSSVTHQDIAERRGHVPRDNPLFDRTRQQRAVGQFVTDLLSAEAAP